MQCLAALFKQTAENILALQRKEIWQVEYLNEDGGITKLVCFLFKINLKLYLK